MRTLLVNPTDPVCSIYQTGTAVRDIVGCDYIEVTRETEIPGGYDAYVFNFHHIAMPWIAPTLLSALPGLKATLVLEVAPGHPFALVAPDRFDRYLCLDPTLEHPDPRVRALPRPLTECRPARPVEGIKIGTMGFGLETAYKNFGDIAMLAFEELGDDITLRIHAPPRGGCVSAVHIGDAFRQEGIHIEATAHYMEREELISWCSENTLNVFLYTRTGVPGIASSPDQPIMSGRPILVNSDATFRHIHPYQPSYPDWSFRDAIEKGEETVARMQRDWSPENFRKAFWEALS